MTRSARPDPPVREDGLCFTCKNPRPAPKKSATNELAIVEAKHDPFCSSPCCRAYHGCGIRVDSIWGQEPVALEAAS